MCVRGLATTFLQTDQVNNNNYNVPLLQESKVKKENEMWTFERVRLLSVSTVYKWIR